MMEIMSRQIVGGLHEAFRTCQEDIRTQVDMLVFQGTQTVFIGMEE